MEFLSKWTRKVWKKTENFVFLVDSARSYPCTFSDAMTYLHDESQNINSIQNFQIKWLCQYFQWCGWKLHYAYIHYFVFFFCTSSSLLLFHTHTLLSLARLTTRVLIVGIILFLLAVVGFVVGKYQLLSWFLGWKATLILLTVSPANLCGIFCVPHSK